MTENFATLRQARGKRDGETRCGVELVFVVGKRQALAELFFKLGDRGAAIGVPSGFESDDDIKLFVVLRPSLAWTPQDMLAHLVRLLPHYMVPRYVQTIEALPRTPTNKVRKAPLYSAAGECWDRKAVGVALLDLARGVGTQDRPSSTDQSP